MLIFYFLIDIKVQFSHGHRNMLILYIFLIDIKNTGIPLLFVSQMNVSVSLVIAVLHRVTKIGETPRKLLHWVFQFVNRHNARS